MWGLLRRQPQPPAGPTAAEWRQRGNAALQRGALDEAAESYRAAVAAAPDDAAAHVNLGYVLLEQGRHAQALSVLASGAALAGERGDTAADALFLLGRAQQAQGKLQDAIASYRAALVARPEFDDALSELVQLQWAAGERDAALATARAACATQSSALRSMLHARALHECGQPLQALAVLDELLAREPGHLGALESRGNLLLELKRPQEALAAFQQVAAVGDDDPQARSNLAAALLRLDRPEEALREAQAALLLQPRHRAALHNCSQAFYELLRVPEGLTVARRAAALHPHDPDLRWNLAVGHLLLGELQPGFEAHEARWQAAGFSSKPDAALLSRPRWDGRQDLAGRSILVYAEQGLGDSIQFLRYVPQVAARAGEVWLKIPASLQSLLLELPPNCRIVPAGRWPEFDLQCPLLSMPHAFGTTLADIPARVPYLHASAERVEAWRQRLPAGTRRVGIAWSGNPLHTNDRNRSIPLALFRAIQAQGCTFVSLQPEVRDTDRAAFDAWPDLVDAGAHLRDFAETAALMESLDLVIAVDTSVAHLAGALGRPVWILLPHVPDWRWMLERSDSPWYPTARLFRQPAARDWPSVLAAVRNQLEALA